MRHRRDVVDARATCRATAAGRALHAAPLVTQSGSSVRLRRARARRARLSCRSACRRTRRSPPRPGRTGRPYITCRRARCCASTGPIGHRSAIAWFSSDWAMSAATSGRAASRAAPAIGTRPSRRSWHTARAAAPAPDGWLPVESPVFPVHVAENVRVQQRVIQRRVEDRGSVSAVPPVTSMRPSSAFHASCAARATSPRTTSRPVLSGEVRPRVGLAHVRDRRRGHGRRAPGRRSRPSRPIPSARPGYPLAPYVVPPPALGVRGRPPRPPTCPRRERASNFATKYSV